MVADAQRNEDIKLRQRRALILLEFSKICPFKWMKNNYYCLHCGDKFVDPASLRDHNVIHDNLSYAQLKRVLSKLKKYEPIKVEITDSSCKLCLSRLDGLADLKTHLWKVHNKNIDPNLPDGVLPFRVTLKDFNCTMCEEKYTDFKALNQHMNIHFQNFICDQCGNGYVTPERLRVHTISHETGSFPCDSCEKTFRSNFAKNEHTANVHMKVKRHKCTQCEESFRNYFQRSKHISLVHGLKLKEFKCEMCPKVFTASGKLGFHVRTVHLKLKRHQCNLCEWKFYSKSELKHHMVKHTGARTFQCGVCKKSYARKYTLSEHMRIHENDRRYVCTICGKGFIQNVSLKQHTKNHHENAHSKLAYDNDQII